MVVRNRLRIRCEFRAAGVHACRCRVDGHVAPHVPRHSTLLKISKRIVDGAASDARVIVHRIPDEHGVLVEQLGVADRVQPAARLVVANRVGLELCGLSFDERLSAQKNGLTVSLHDERLGDVTGDAIAGQLEQRVDHVIGHGKRAGRSRRQAEPACG